MMHVTAIKKIVEQGDHEKAHHSLEGLLELGPNNLEALKLKAMLYEAEGRFADESAVWQRILKVDREDPDAISYLFKQQSEDREHFYFTDDLPEGGRRFLTYPRALFDVSLIGFFGCISFFALRGLSGTYPALATPEAIVSSFLLLVMGPWLGIVYIWLRSIKSVSIREEGLSIETRFRSLFYRWEELNKVVLARSPTEDKPAICLVIIPKDEEKRAVILDLNDGSSALRAKTHLVREIAEKFAPFDHADFSSLGLENRKVRTY